MVTTIKLEEKTKKDLDKFREYARESYENIVRKLIYVAETAKKEPKLSKKTVLDIEAARTRIASGKYYTEKDAKKILGL
ncbi:hypothetical protein IIC68_03040 [archaeon]|nr:hypothetical protein [archaeon]